MNHKPSNYPTTQLSNSLQRGQMMILALLFLAITLILSASLFDRVANFVRFGGKSVDREKAVQLADAGVDYAIWQLGKTNGSYGGDETVNLGTTGKFKIDPIITPDPLNPTLKIVTSTGCIPNCTNYKEKRTVQAELTTTTEVANIKYVAHSGLGEFTVSQSTINGNTTPQTAGNTFANNSNVTCQNGGTINAYSYRLNGKSYSLSCGGPNTTVIGGDSLIDAGITDWQDWLTANGETINCASQPTECSIQGSKSAGNRIYQGNVTIGQNSTLTLTGPIWVQGYLSIGSPNSNLLLDQSWGSIGTKVIVDGQISIGSGGRVLNISANPQSWIWLITKSTSKSFNTSAAIYINVSSQVDAILHAKDGSVYALGSNTVPPIYSTVIKGAVIADRFRLTLGTKLDYDPSLAAAKFGKGPLEEWAVKRGTYKFK